mgnify:CR=1 FL=1
MIVALVAIYYIVNNIALPRIASVLAERNGTITNDIAAAEELKLRAVEADALLAAGVGPPLAKLRQPQKDAPRNGPPLGGEVAPACRGG